MIILSMLLVLLAATGAVADPVSEITAMMMEQDDAWNRGDLDGFLQPYDDSGRLVFVSTSVIRSAAELEQKYKKRYGAGGADFGKLSFSELQVEELVPGLARAWGKWTVQEKSKKSSGWFTLILQKEENRWRIIHDHSS